MRRLAFAGTVAATALLLTLPLLAADTLPWPWKSKSTPDPALSVLAKITEVSATVSQSAPPILTISVKAQAPSEGFGDLALTPRMGDPNDRIFAFDARGRAGQSAKPAASDVSFEASYQDAPIGKFDVIEVYGQSNCMAYSVKDNKPTDCTSNPPPQDQ